MHLLWGMAGWEEGEDGMSYHEEEQINLQKQAAVDAYAQSQTFKGYDPPAAAPTSPYPPSDLGQGIGFPGISCVPSPERVYLQRDGNSPIYTLDADDTIYFNNLAKDRLTIIGSQHGRAFRITIPEHWLIGHATKASAAMFNQLLGATTTFIPLTFCQSAETSIGSEVI